MLMFSSFNAWRSHEIDHRREWFCPTCDLVYHDKVEARTHITQHYGNSNDHQQLDLLLQTSSRLPEHLSADDCPFCDWSATLRKRNITPKDHNLTVPSRRFMKHLGRHLEEIALFIVPQPEEDGVDSGDIGSNAVHAARDEDATNSTLSSFTSNRPSVASADSQNSRESLHDNANRGICPHPTCGVHFRDLKAHMLIHQNERPEKCPNPSCQYHTKGFARRYDRNQHVLTHYIGTIVCGLCPGSGTSAEKSFSRVDVFKRHLTSVHGAEQTLPKSRRRANPERSSETANHGGTGKCSTCGNTFSRVQDFYDHLDDCILSDIQELLLVAEPVDPRNLVETPRHKASLPNSPGMLELSPPMTPVFLQLASQGPTYPHSPGSTNDEEYRSKLSEHVNQNQLVIPRQEVDSAASNPDMFTNYLDQSHTTLVPDMQAEWLPAPNELPFTWQTSPSPHRNLVNERLQSANTLRSSSPYSTSVERSPFDLASSAPREHEWTGSKSAIRAQQANAMLSQDYGEEIVPASNNPSSSHMYLPNETLGSIDPTMRTSSNYEGAFGPNSDTRRQQRQAQLQRRAQIEALQHRQMIQDQEGRPRHGMLVEADSPTRRSDFATDFPTAISPKHALLDFHDDTTPANTQPSVQQSQTNFMQQWPSMLNSQSDETYNPYHPQPSRPVSSAFANEPTSAPRQIPDYQLQLQFLEKENRRRLLMARQGNDYMAPNPGWATDTAVDPTEIELFRRQAKIGPHEMSDSQIRDYIVCSGSKSFLYQNLAPQQADDQHPSSSPQAPIPPHDSNATASASRHWDYLATTEVLRQQSEERLAKAWPAIPAPTLSSVKNTADPQPQHAWQTADSETMLPSYGSSREDAHVNFANSVAERTSQPGAVPPYHVGSWPLEGLSIDISDDFEAAGRTGDFEEISSEELGRIIDEWPPRRSSNDSHQDEQYVPTEQRSNNPSPSTSIPRESHSVFPYGEEDFKASERITPMSQASEVHSGQDALKVLYEAAVYGMVHKVPSSHDLPSEDTHGEFVTRPISQPDDVPQRHSISDETWEAMRPRPEREHSYSKPDNPQRYVLDAHTNSRIGSDPTAADNFLAETCGLSTQRNPATTKPYRTRLISAGKTSAGKTSAGETSTKASRRPGSSAKGTTQRTPNTTMISLSARPRARQLAKMNWTGSGRCTIGWRS